MYEKFVQVMTMEGGVCCLTRKWFGFLAFSAPEWKCCRAVARVSCPVLQRQTGAAAEQQITFSQPSHMSLSFFSLQTTATFPNIRPGGAPWCQDKAGTAGSAGLSGEGPQDCDLASTASHPHQRCLLAWCAWESRANTEGLVSPEGLVWGSQRCSASVELCLQDLPGCLRYRGFQ